MGGRQRGGEYAVSVLGRVERRHPGKKSINRVVRGLLTKREECPVCLGSSLPGDLESHLFQYHSLEDMRDSLRIALNVSELPGPLRFLISHGEKRAVARIFSNYKITGLLQIPTLPSRQSYTRVLWRKLNEQPVLKASNGHS